MKIVFFGDTDFSRPTIDSLKNEGYDLVSVISKSDGSLKDETMFEKFKSLDPDLCIVADYGRIIPARYIDTPKYKFINIHPSLLPKYRGPTPIQSAIINGEIKTGVTIMVVDAEVDHGPILATMDYRLSPSAYFSEIRNELAKIGAKLLIDILPKWLSFEVKPQRQDHAQATFTKMFSRDDGKINWSKTTLKILNQIRALNPEPGTWCRFGDKILNIKKAALSDEIVVSDGEPGHVIKNGPHVFIKTGDGLLELLVVQLESKKEMSVLDFLNGYPKFIGSKLN